MTPVISYIQAIAARALLDEVGTTPKPGLVDLHDNGAHKDMCYDTFVTSTDAVAPYIARMAQEGLTWNGPLPGLFGRIRPIGVEAEQAMFRATNGVNTHKGIIFSLGIIAASAGYDYGRRRSFDCEAILTACRDMTFEALEGDFGRIDPENPKTHGERLYVRYGCRGIRGEAQDGFPSIRTVALPAMRKLISENPGTDRDKIYLHILLTLMAQVDDTNILTRSDPETLAYAKREAARILDCGSAFTAQGMAETEKLNLDFIKRNISPGGCADLLAITIFLWLLEQYEEDFHRHRGAVAHPEIAVRFGPR